MRNKYVRHKDHVIKMAAEIEANMMLYFRRQDYYCGR